MSIATYLDELSDPRLPVKSGRLITLSGLSDDERGQLAARWPEIRAERREDILQRLSALAEDNPELDFDAVFMVALDDDDATVRRLAIEGLWEHQERDVIPPLVRLVADDPDPEVRSAAALALGRFVLLGEFDEVRPRDLALVTGALRRSYEDGAEEIDVRRRAIESLGASSQPWVRDLIEDAYASGDPDLAASALHAMGRSADTYWLPSLLDELESDDPRMRFEAAAALGEIEDEDAIAQLAERFDDDDPEVQEAAILALGKIGEEDAIAILRERSRDPDERVREAVKAALEEAEFGDDPLGLRA